MMARHYGIVGEGLETDDVIATIHHLSLGKMQDGYDETDDEMMSADLVEVTCIYVTNNVNIEQPNNHPTACE